MNRLHKRPVSDGNRSGVNRPGFGWRETVRSLNSCLLAGAVVAAWLSTLGIISELVLSNCSLAVRAAFAQTSKTNQHDESWQVIHLDGQRVGYSHSMTRRITQQGQRIVLTELEEHMQLKRFGQVLKLQVSVRTDETESGQMLGFVFEMKNPPAILQRTVGRIEDESLILTSSIGGVKKTTTMDWDPEIKPPAFQDRLLQNPPLKPGETRSFKTFLPHFNQVSIVKITAEDNRSVKLFDGRQKEALRISITQSAMPGITERAYLDKQGNSLKSETSMLGMQMVHYTVPKAVALEAIAGAELDIAVKTLVRVEQSIRKPHQTSRVVYRITIKDDDPTGYIVVGPTQRVNKVDDETVDLTVTTVRPGVSPRRVPVDEQFLQATQYLQCRDDRVMEHAARAVAHEEDPVRMAFRMERYVHEKLIKKNFSTALASAAEVAKSLEGDCTEHAVLLAAMLRAKRIPSKIAVGMVYIEAGSSFGGHMWTEAFLAGQWVPLDATLGKGGIGAAHIKLAESSFVDNAGAPVTTFLPLLKVLGKIQIKVVEFE